ncbi:MAG TPA: hypothetical protein VGS97_05215 [Actinocrinis sp.]|uniref:DUF6919 domain-containing protein n=1 Tax=Actinocrinis sp. TaxID=1920516 RepID=UPI002DDC9DCD|nr:hypothetical protein [Actinocrinis sp.]HEV2343473.1 hypothetical protein [Actinocrinis sp.]
MRRPRSLIRAPFERRLWQHAVSLADLGELTARWLEGRIGYHPSYGAPHPETLPLVPVLAQLNRSGFITISSQPGHDERAGFDGALWAQRPAVEGITDTATASRLCAAAVNTGLHVVSAPAAASFEQVVGKAFTVTTRAGEPHAVFGPATWSGVLDLFFNCQQPALRAALRAAWQVTITDPAWSESDLLWRTLAAADLTGARHPYPSRLG